MEDRYTAAGAIVEQQPVMDNKNSHIEEGNASFQADLSYESPANTSNDDSTAERRDGVSRIQQEDSAESDSNKNVSVDELNENSPHQNGIHLKEQQSEQNDISLANGGENYAEPGDEFKHFLRVFDDFGSDSVNETKCDRSCKDTCQSRKTGNQKENILNSQVAASNTCRPNESVRDISAIANDNEEINKENDNVISTDEKHQKSRSPDSKCKKSKGKREKKKENKFRAIDQTCDFDYEAERKKANKKYHFFWQKGSVFSQWRESVFYCDNQKFTCAEQYMMHQKAVLFSDWDIAAKILQAKEPRQMKSLGRKVRNFSDEVWNANCLNIVKNATIAKFSQDKHLQEELFSTHPKILVEASPLDCIWGIGHGEADPDAWDESTWRGKNYLGYIITEVRDEMMAEAGIIEKEHKKVFLPTLIEKMQQAKKRKLICPREGHSEQSERGTYAGAVRDRVQSEREADAEG